MFQFVLEHLHSCDDSAADGAARDHLRSPPSRMAPTHGCMTARLQACGYATLQTHTTLVFIRGGLKDGGTLCRQRSWPEYEGAIEGLAGALVHDLELATQRGCRHCLEDAVIARVRVAVRRVCFRHFQFWFLSLRSDPNPCGLLAGDGIGLADVHACAARTVAVESAGWSVSALAYAFT